MVLLERLQMRICDNGLTGVETQHGINGKYDEK